MTRHLRIPRWSAIALTTALAAPVSAFAQSPAFDSPVVSPEWLSQHLNDPDLVVLNIANNRREYTSGHVPGARMLWFGALAPGNPDLATELPPLAQLDSIIESLGISNNSRIVVYSAQVSPAAGRAYMTLDYLGLGDRTAMLDGGFAGWKERNLPVSTETPTVKRGKFTPRPNASAVVTADFVNASIDKPGVKILDARTSNFYSGEAAGMGGRAGHIPSAGSVPFTSLVDEKGMLKSRAAIAGMLAGAGVKPGDRVVTYCHIGQQGSLLYFASRYAGYQTSLYDGSMEDWGARTELPLVVEKKP
jgi:thiosulfate/3-mercaptopyruvate sulfurtransferase